MSFEDYVFAVDFLAQSGFREIKLIGGEPSLHKQFKEIISYNNERGLKTLVFTNGIMDANTVDYLSQFETVNYLVNMNETEEYAKEELDKLDYLFSNLSKHTSLGFNFYKSGQSISFIEDLVLKYGLKREIRIGIAVKTAGDRTDNNDHKLQKEVLRYLAGRAREIHEKRIVLTADCGSLPVCICKEKYLGELLKYVNYTPKFKCDEVVDIGCDLDVWRCFATSNLFSRNLREFKNYDEVAMHFKNSFAVLKLLGSSEKCGNCVYRETDRCDGGCLAAVYNTYRDFREPVNCGGHGFVKIRIAEGQSDVINLRSGKAFVFKGIYHDVFRMIDARIDPDIIAHKIKDMHMMTTEAAEKYTAELIAILEDCEILERGSRRCN